MKPVKDRHLDTPGEANGDKHINFLAEEMGDVAPAGEKFNDETEANENTEDVDNGFFTDDDNELQTKEENENDKSMHASAPQQRVSPLEPDNKTTLADRISVNKNNDDILSGVKDNSNPDYTNEDDQAH